MNLLDLDQQANGQPANIATPVASTSPLSFSPGYVPDEDFELEARRLEAMIGGYWGE
ncbi:hypothetical protein [Caudoviricetes sp.]|nr:hypothetical protein [Caudoviricetes sp.]